MLVNGHDRLWTVHWGPVDTPPRTYLRRRGFVGFEGLTEPVRDEIERLVFRQHRRQVAEARASAAQG